MFDVPDLSMSFPLQFNKFKMAHSGRNDSYSSVFKNGILNMPWFESNFPRVSSMSFTWSIFS